MSAMSMAWARSIRTVSQPAPGRFQKPFSDSKAGCSPLSSSTRLALQYFLRPGHISEVLHFQSYLPSVVRQTGGFSVCAQANIHHLTVQASLQNPEAPSLGLLLPASARSSSLKAQVVGGYVAKLLVIILAQGLYNELVHVVGKIEYVIAGGTHCSVWGRLAAPFTVSPQA